MWYNPADHDGVDSLLNGGDALIPVARRSWSAERQRQRTSSLAALALLITSSGDHRKDPLLPA
jgi:hypothetical protein